MRGTQAKEPIALEAPVGDHDLVQVISLESAPVSQSTVAPKSLGTPKDTSPVARTKSNRASKTIEVTPIPIE